MEIYSAPTKAKPVNIRGYGFVPEPSSCGRHRSRRSGWQWRSRAISVIEASNGIEVLEGKNAAPATGFVA